MLFQILKIVKCLNFLMFRMCYVCHVAKLYNILYIQWDDPERSSYLHETALHTCVCLFVCLFICLLVATNQKILFKFFYDILECLCVL